MKFALTDVLDIGKYVAQIVADPRTINRGVLAYTEVLSMNEIWDVMAKASGEDPPKEYVRFIYACKVQRTYGKLTHIVTLIYRFQKPNSTRLLRLVGKDLRPTLKAHIIRVK